MITLSPQQEEDLIDECKKEAVAKFVKSLISNNGLNPMLSCAQAAGILNVTTQTLRKLPIPSYDVSGNGGTVCYRLADLESYLETQKVS